MKTQTLTFSILAVFLTACSTTPKEVKTIEINKPAPIATPHASTVLNEDCAKFAKFTRSIAVMRDAGVPIDDVHLLIANKPEYQINPIIREVYTRQDILPDAGATNSYTVCLRVGFDNMVAALDKAEKDNVRIEHERLKAALSAKKKKKSKISSK